MSKLYEFYFKETTRENYTLNDAWKSYKKNCTVGKADSTVYNYEWRFNTYFSDTLGDCKLKNITQAQIKSVFEAIIIKYDLVWDQVRINRCVLSNILEHAVDNGIISANPAADIKALKIDRNLCAPDLPSGDKTRCYAKAELTTFKSEAKRRLEKYPQTLSTAAALLIAYTGIRIGECAALKFTDVDFDGKYLRIRRMEVFGKDNGLKIVDHGKKKSVHALRKIALNDDAIHLIKHCQEVQKMYGFHDNEYIFCNKHGRVTRYAIDGAIRRMCKKIDITPYKSAHDLRRTVITKMYEKMGHESIDAIRRYAGHSSIKQTIAYIYGTDTTEEEDEKIRLALS